jgi:hypothetical protein
MTFSEGSADLPGKNATNVDKAVAALKSVASIEAQRDRAWERLMGMVTALTPAEAKEYAERTGATA